MRLLFLSIAYALRADVALHGHRLSGATIARVTLCTLVVAFIAGRKPVDSES
jgi:hypothetical protein